mgnify:CR=1 FL=1
MNLKYLNIKKNTLLNLCYKDTILKENCLIVRVIKDNYFSEGLIVYIHCNKKHVVDLNNCIGLYFSE